MDTVEFCRGRAKSYGALRKSSVTAIALDKAAAEIEALRAALEPFARHLNEMKFDLDNEGNELPDDQPVGWIYLTNGDFRNARQALKGTDT